MSGYLTRIAARENASANARTLQSNGRSGSPLVEHDQRPTVAGFEGLMGGSPLGEGTEIGTEAELAAEAPTSRVAEPSVPTLTPAPARAPVITTGEDPGTVDPSSGSDDSGTEIRTEVVRERGSTPLLTPAPTSPTEGSTPLPAPSIPADREVEGGEDPVAESEAEGKLQAVANPAAVLTQIFQQIYGSEEAPTDHQPAPEPAAPQRLEPAAPSQLPPAAELSTPAEDAAPSLHVGTIQIEVVEPPAAQRVAAAAQRTQRPTTPARAPAPRTFSSTSARDRFGLGQL